MLAPYSHMDRIYCEQLFINMTVFLRQCKSDCAFPMKWATLQKQMFHVCLKAGTSLQVAGLKVSISAWSPHVAWHLWGSPCSNSQPRRQYAAELCLRHMKSIPNKRVVANFFSFVFFFFIRSFWLWMANDRRLQWERKKTHKINWKSLINLWTQITLLNDNCL